MKYSEKIRQIVEIDAADNFRFYVTTLKAMNFQDIQHIDHIQETPSYPIDNFKYQHVLVFDLNWMQDATEICHNRTSWRAIEAGTKLYFSS